MARHVNCPRGCGPIFQKAGLFRCDKCGLQPGSGVAGRHVNKARSDTYEASAYDPGYAISNPNFAPIDGKPIPLDRRIK